MIEHVCQSKRVQAAISGATSNSDNLVQADAGVDPGNFARNLMREARKAAEASCQNAEGPLDSFQILCTALANSRHIIGAIPIVIVHYAVQKRQVENRSCS
jgi:hypothetical protein